MRLDQGRHWIVERHGIGQTKQFVKFMRHSLVHLPDHAFDEYRKTHFDEKWVFLFSSKAWSDKFTKLWRINFMISLVCPISCRPTIQCCPWSSLIFSYIFFINVLPHILTPTYRYIDETQSTVSSLLSIVITELLIILLIKFLHLCEQSYCVLPLRYIIHETEIVPYQLPVLHWIRSHEIKWVL